MLYGVAVAAGLLGFASLPMRFRTSRIWTVFFGCFFGSEHSVLPVNSSKAQGTDFVCGTLISTPQNNILQHFATFCKFLLEHLSSLGYYM